MTKAQQKLAIFIDIEGDQDTDDSNEISSMKVAFRIGPTPGKPYFLSTVLRGTLLGLSAFAEVEVQKQGFSPERAKLLITKVVKEVFAADVRDNSTVLDLRPRAQEELN